MQIACPACHSSMIVPQPVGAAAPALAQAPGLRISASAPPPPPPAPIGSSQTGATCPSCGNPVAPRAIVCVKCGTNLKTGQKMRPGAQAVAAAAVSAAPTVWYKTAYPYVGAYMVLLAVLYFLGQSNPTMKLALVGAMALYVVAAHIVTTVCAFVDDGAGKGILCFCIGIYAIYYVFKESERPFLKVIVTAECLLGLALKFMPLAGD